MSLNCSLLHAQQEETRNVSMLKMTYSGAYVVETQNQGGSSVGPSGGSSVGPSLGSFAGPLGGNSVELPVESVAGPRGGSFEN